MELSFHCIRTSTARETLIGSTYVPESVLEKYKKLDGSYDIQSFLTDLDHGVYEDELTICNLDDICDYDSGNTYDTIEIQNYEIEKSQEDFDLY